MMLRSLKIAIIFSLFFCKYLQAQQNLVSNPSFEQYTSCPDALCQIHRSTGWSSWGYSPDYYNSCAAPYPISRVSIPRNDFGYQYPFSGNAYAGFYAFEPIVGPDIREYISAQLISPLIVNTKYYLRFRVSLSDISSVAVNKIGVLFSTVSFFIDSTSACTNTITSMIPRNFAHSYSNSVITDTTNWTMVFGSFIADSAYQYLSIGNHFTDINVVSLPSNTQSACCYAYYYLDDVYVGTDSLTAVGIAKNEIENNIIIYPNPASDEIRITLLNNGDNNIVRIYDILGVIVEEEKISAADNLISLQNLKAGIYFVSVRIKNEIATRKLIITKN